MKTPLGAYYRVNARRLDDMQSALTELNAVAASAAIHEGWRKPVREMHNGQPIWVIRRPEGRDPEPLGGHAFLLAGYNDVGFLVQNSWGTTWGRHGYATLPYADWLDNAYDAWVARPGVPQVGIVPRRRKVIPAGGGFVVGAGMDLVRLQVVRGRRHGGRPDGHEGQGDERPGPDRRPRREDGGRHRRLGDAGAGQPQATARAVRPWRARRRGAGDPRSPTG